MRAGHVTIGVGTLVSGLVLGAVWLSVAVLGIGSISGAGASELALIAGSSTREGRALLEQGQSAERSGDLALADRRYRGAWSSQSTRDAAARELYRLHRRSGFTRQVDEEQVSEVERILGPRFARTQTDHFVILSDADRAWTRQRAQLLERTARQFRRVMDRLEYPSVPPGKKLLCVFFREHSAYRAFASSEDGVEASWIAGYYTGLENRAVFYDDRTGPAFLEAFNQLEGHKDTVAKTRLRVVSMRKVKDLKMASSLAAHADDLERDVAREQKRLMDEVQESSESKAIHEAVHLLAFNSGVQSRAREYPFWLTEGMASSFETGNPNASFGPDRPTRYREDEFDRAVSSGLLSLKKFVVMTEVPQDDPELADVMYAQAYSLLAYMYRYERKALGEYLEAIWSEEAGVRSQREHLELFEKHFGRVGAIEHRWLTRSRRLMASASD
jgi:uncharacterized protein DUF1570